MSFTRVQLNTRYRKKHRTRYRIANAAHQRRQYQTNPAFRIMKLLRTRLKHWLNGVYAPRTALDKETVAFLKWSAERKGIDPKKPVGYHVDHLMPLATLDPKDPAMRAFASSPANVRWLSAWENLRRGSNLPSRKEQLAHRRHVAAWRKTL